MSSFPKIESLCPYIDRLDSIMDGDHCRMCKRDVTDLTAMADAERVVFLNSCDGPVCVTYRFPVRRSLAAAALAATLVASPAAAQAVIAPADPSPAATPALAGEAAEDEIIVVTGGRIARIMPVEQAPASTVAVPEKLPGQPALKPAPGPAHPKAAKPSKGG